MRDQSAPPLCLGTAGHVDHGKTWLVKALTGKDTDRLPAERARGISIDLGYAPLDLPGGRRVSLVDVPGHERFVRTMIAGASGIDLFLLVIDAAEGARAQTHEHLAVLRLLGVTDGVVAVSKSDRVDAPGVERALVEARRLVPGRAVVAVSAKTGTGLDELRSALASGAERVAKRPLPSGPTRLFVDRAFTLRGIGTVATGTLWSGAIAAGDALRVEPVGRAVRVRSVQVHDSDVPRAKAAQRVAVALPGIRPAELRRGFALVEPHCYRPSYRLDVALEELEPVAHGRRVRVHHGTADLAGRVVRIGERFAQLRLAEPAVAARGDRVVLRAETTVAGGQVLDAAPPRHSDAARFERLERGDAEAPTDDPDALELAAPLSRPTPSTGGRAEAAAAVEQTVVAGGFTGAAVEDSELATQLERSGRIVRLAGGWAVGIAAYEEARRALVAEGERAGSITLARFRDVLGISRRPAQLLLERFDVDRVTRRVGDERVLRRGALRP
jgi:selenocysteine-specific elongation factor